MMQEIYEKISEISERKIKSGYDLWNNSREVNSLYFRSRLPECEEHDIFNLIDSEGEERFEKGLVNSFGSDGKFLDLYQDFYYSAMNSLLDRLSKSV